MSAKKTPKQVTEKGDAAAWARLFLHARRKGLSFVEAFDAFKAKFGKAPNLRWPLMPTRETDHYREIRNVPAEFLTRAKQPKEKLNDKSR